MRKGFTEISMGGKETQEDEGQVPAKTQNPKPPFRPVKDDTKPLLRDPISRSDPIETEQAVLRLPPFNKSQLYSKQSGMLH
ncbi:hypothetical protein J5N97_005682 [Dioscorea zingiberensis]|uniref:Uncharacterized protein n=1 Tax=Dioscorea zingiberensis TaxID=325984 RepID=A0A9D5D8X3_9LILI|nr:hypothetical protein J5N97_005682 [Dioscorea zingiberensis]